jgi:hypothetical protein
VIWVKPLVVPDPDVANPVGALLLLGATVFLLAAMYLVCYTFFMANWEGWESWNRRTGLDAEIAEDERLKRRGLK